MFDKDEQEISQLIDFGLEEILSGNATLEQFLAQYADQAAVLRPELEAAMWLYTHSDDVRTRPGFLSTSRKRVLNRIKQEAKNSGAKRSIFSFLWPQKVAYQWAAALMVVILFFSGTGGMVSAAQAALPGEDLYGIKRASEEIIYVMSFDDVRRIELSTYYTQRRLDEVLAMLEKGDQTNLRLALQDFETQVNHTIAILHTLNSVSPQEKRELAIGVYQNFSSQASRLSSLHLTVGEDLRGDIEAVEQLMLVGATQAADEANNIFDPTSTPIVVFTLTPSPNSTQTASSTPPAPIDPSTPDPNELDESYTDPETDPTLPDKVKKPTKTPKPTNENRPADPSDKPEEKPPKDEKPEKPEKPEHPLDKDK